MVRLTLTNGKPAAMRRSCLTLKRRHGLASILALVVRKRLWLRLRSSTATDLVSSSCRHGRQIWLSTIKPWRTTSRRGFVSIRSRRLLTRSKPHPRLPFDSSRQASRCMTSTATITCKRATNGREPSIQAGLGTQVRFSPSILIWNWQGSPIITLYG